MDPNKPTGHCCVRHWHGGMFLDPSSFGDSFFRTPLLTCFITLLPSLIWSSHLFVKHGSALAQRAGIAPAVIAAFGTRTAFAQLSIIIAAIINGSYELATGAIIGCTIANVIRGFVASVDDCTGLIANVIRGQVASVGDSAGLGKESLTRSRQEAPEEEYGAEVLPGAAKDALPAARILDDAISEHKIASLAVQPKAQGQRSEYDALLPSTSTRSTAPTLAQQDDAVAETRPIPAAQHIFFFLLGTLATLLSAGSLVGVSHNLAYCFCLSDTLFAITALSPAFVLPYALIAALSSLMRLLFRQPAEGVSSHSTGMDTARSNIILVALYIGLTAIGNRSRDDFAPADVKPAELLLLLSSTALFIVNIWLPKWMRCIMAALALGGYVAFLVLEYQMIRKGEITDPWNS